MKRLPRHERGSATVHAITATALAIVLACVAWQLIALVRLRHQVESAADLAALAASRAAADGTDGCEAARALARRGGARLQACRMDLAVATVTTRDSTVALWGGRWTAQARARAAPADYAVP